MGHQKSRNQKESKSNYPSGDNSGGPFSLLSRVISSGIINQGKKSRFDFFSSNFIKQFGTSLAIFSTAFFVALLTSSSFAPVQNSSADTINATLTAGGHYVSIASSGTVNLNLTSTADGAKTIGMDTVTTTTNSETGYKLYISSNANTNASRNMYYNDDTTSGYYLTPSAGTVASPVPLATNTWGYALTSTTGNNGTVTKNSNFIGVPSFGTLSSNVINSVSSATTSSSVNVYYGVNANTVLPSGTYTSRIVYTVIAEALDTPSQDISVTSTPVTDGSTIEIATGLYTNMTDLGSITVTVAGKPCSNVTILDNGNSQAGYVNLSCTLPPTSDTANRLSDNGMKTVSVNYTKFGKTFTASNALEYFLPWSRLTYMQDMTAGACAQATEATASNYASVQKTLTDNRDSNTYIVRKLKDGNCWMTENLRLTFKNGQAVDKNNSSTLTTLTSHNSDFTTLSSWSGGGTTETSSAHTQWPEADASRSYTFGNEKANSGDTNQYKGVLYTWYTATANQGLYSAREDITIEDSICPKGWRLPIGGRVTTSKSFYGLLNDVSISAMGSAPYSFIFAGMYVEGGNVAYQTGGYYHSATSEKSSSFSNYGWRYSSTSDVQYVHVHWGLNVRCVSR